MEKLFIKEVLKEILMNLQIMIFILMKKEKNGLKLPKERSRISRHNDQ